MTIRPSSRTILLLALVFDYVIAKSVPLCRSSATAEIVKTAVELEHTQDGKTTRKNAWVCVNPRTTPCAGQDPMTESYQGWKPRGDGTAAGWKALTCEVAGREGSQEYYMDITSVQMYCVHLDEWACLPAEAEPVLLGTDHAKQSYIEELADFYYDEGVEQARKARSWFILNGQKKRADRAAAHGSMYADDLLYDYYENVNVETRRAQDVYDRLQRENVNIQAKRDQVSSSKKRIRRKPKPKYRYH
eukprot:925590_1